jgi:hypothetical protein
LKTLLQEDKILKNKKIKKWKKQERLHGKGPKKGERKKNKKRET